MEEKVVHLLWRLICQYFLVTFMGTNITLFFMELVPKMFVVNNKKDISCVYRIAIAM